MTNLQGGDEGDIAGTDSTGSPRGTADTAGVGTGSTGTRPDSSQDARCVHRRGGELRSPRSRYARHLVARAEVDELTAWRVVRVLFDQRDWPANGCECACHRRLGQ